MVLLNWQSGVVLWDPFALTLFCVPWCTVGQALSTWLVRRICGMGLVLLFLLLGLSVWWVVVPSICLALDVIGFMRLLFGHSVVAVLWVHVELILSFPWLGMVFEGLKCLCLVGLQVLWATFLS